MFDEVRICGLGSIAEAVLELDPGLTVLSGETGAGKSSVVRAFALLAGGRADVGQIRGGSSSAAVEARLIVDPAGALAGQVREAGGELEGSSLIIARTVSADGRSRAFVGGRAVPVGLLAELLRGVLALHGQSSQLQLRHPGAQRAALDRFAGRPVLEPLEAFRAARERWSAARREQAELQALASERAREVELLRLGLAEVERVAPVGGEDFDLDRELGRLGAADQLRCASETARAALAGADDSAGSDGGGAVASLAFAARALDAAAGSDPELAALSDRVHEVSMLANELVGDLASYAAGVDDDPRRLAVAQERRAELTRLCRPHSTGVDGVLRWAADAEGRLSALLAGGERTTELYGCEQAAAEEMLALAAQLSAARHAAARALAARVTAELAALSMTTARLDVGIESSTPDSGEVAGARPAPCTGVAECPCPAECTAVAESTCPLDTGGGYDLAATGPRGACASRAAALLGAEGADEIELLFAPGEGLPLRPLARSASGGELSRVVLALEVVLAAGLGPASMVFDEVDAGIGGEAALEVGRRLAVLGRSRQVICVTHLPQVAAFADRHLLVAKSGRGAAVHSSVSVLDQQDRVCELSRMLAGVSNSELARGHAAELLASASAATEPSVATEPPVEVRPGRPAARGRPVAPSAGARSRPASRDPIGAPAS